MENKSTSAPRTNVGFETTIMGVVSLERGGNKDEEGAALGRWRRASDSVETSQPILKAKRTGRPHRRSIEYGISLIGRTV